MYRFRRAERLKSNKVISDLFDKNKSQSFGNFPLRLIWLPLEERLSDVPVQFALSVPKKSFKKATTRNVLRRRIREAYRLNKHTLYESLSEKDCPQYAWMILFTGKEVTEYQEIEAAMKSVIRRFLKQIA